MPLSPFAATQITPARTKGAAGGPPAEKGSPGDSLSPKEPPVRDSPLTREEALRIAVVLSLVVSAAMFLAMFLAYDVYQSFGKLPAISNVTAAASSTESTTELPTPFFMR
ncbi:uncharacterized protein LOC144157937 [Haemaphysalis longicornis]